MRKTKLERLLARRPEGIFHGTIINAVNSTRAITRAPMIFQLSSSRREMDWLAR
jgi:hypothetical protein